MVNENILTSLKNAMDRSETIEHAMNTLILAGYSKKEVEEASIFFGGGAKKISEIRPNEQLVFPSQKGTLRPEKPLQMQVQPQNQSLDPRTQLPPSQPLASQPNRPANPLTNIQRPTAPPQIQAQAQKIPDQHVYTNTRPLPVLPNDSLSRELDKIHPPRKSWIKEIFLLVVLMILISILGIVILFREDILRLFS